MAKLFKKTSLSIFILSLMIFSLYSALAADITLYWNGTQYTDSGTYSSSVLDTHSSDVYYCSVSWDSMEPANTDIVMQLRSGDSEPLAGPFVGPDYTQSTSYQDPPEWISILHNSDRFIEWKATLSTTDTSETPILYSVKINYTDDGDKGPYDCECAVRDYDGICNPGDGKCWYQEGSVCCGDDPGESYVSTDYYNDACCDNSGDFVAYNGTCQIKSDRVYLYGRVMGQIPNGTYVPLYHALIQAVDPVYGRLVNQNYTNHDGYYNISAVKGIRYSLELRPSEAYDGKTVVLPIINVDTKTDFYITLLSSCREDCTSFNLEDNKYYCDKDCDGTNGCSFNQSVVSDSSIYPPGSTMKELCDELSPGWTVFHNSTYDIQCCKQGYVRKPESHNISISLDGDYNTMDSFYAGLVSHNGKFYSVWVAIGDN